MYDITTELDIDYNEAIKRVKEELSKEGFGVLTEIDVKDTLKKKLDVDYTDYIILGACNPPLAKKALDADKEIGLLLPCNVIVYKKNNKTIVSSIKPKSLFNLVENEDLKELADIVEEKLKKVIDHL